ncbi:MAG: hypothetical protein R6U15_00140 [Candidatus Izemoplasmatales bacterium]
MTVGLDYNEEFVIKVIGLSQTSMILLKSFLSDMSLTAILGILLNVVLKPNKEIKTKLIYMK